MSANALSGSDTLSIVGTLLPDLADSDPVTLEFDADIETTKKGKNGNSLFVQNEQGDVAMMTIRLVRGSPSDKYLQGLWANQKNNFPSFAALYGSYTKKIGDGLGNVTTDTQSLSGGMFSRNVDAKSTAEGNVDSAVSIWKIRWAKAVRVMG